jgi:hypothetical protein
MEAAALLPDHAETAPAQLRRSLIAAGETAPSARVSPLVIQLRPTGGLVVVPSSLTQLVEKSLSHVQQVAELLPINPEHERIMDRLMAKHRQGGTKTPITRRSPQR